MKNLILIISFFLYSEINFAQSASDYFTVDPGFRWQFVVTPLDSLNNEIDTLDWRFAGQKLPSGAIPLALVNLNKEIYVEIINDVEPQKAIQKLNELFSEEENLKTVELDSLEILES